MGWLLEKKYVGGYIGGMINKIAGWGVLLNVNVSVPKYIVDPFCPLPLQYFIKIHNLYKYVFK